MTTRTKSNSNSRTYGRLADLPVAEQEGILFRLITRHAARVSSRFNGWPDAEDLAIAEAYRIFSNLQAFCLDGPHTAEEAERFVVNRYYFYARDRVYRYAARSRAYNICSLDELVERAGDGAIPQSDYGMPSVEMSEADVCCMLAQLGVHDDWLYLFRWVAMHDLSWQEVVGRVQTRCRVRFDEQTMRQRWSRLCKDLGPGVAAGLAGMPLDAFRLKAGHWATRPMKEPVGRRR